MGAYLGTFFQQTDTDIPLLPMRQGLEVNSRRQAGRASADNDHVIFHGLTLHGFGHDYPQITQIRTDVVFSGYYIMRKT